MARCRMQSSSSSEDEGEDRSWGQQGWAEMSKRFHHAGCLIEEKRESWKKSLKESQKREEGLVTLTTEAKKNQEKKAERKGELLKSYEAWVGSRETWAACREEARRAEDAAREAREAFEKHFAKLLEKDDMLEEETRMIADKMWQAFQSNHTKGLNLAQDLDDLVTAMEDNGWEKSRKKLCSNLVKVVEYHGNVQRPANSE